jgi:FtsZ-binding cell division protein ZapB
MKTKKNQFVRMALCLSLTLATFSGAMANDEQYLNSDPIDINGYVKADVDSTDKELESIRGQVNYAKQQSHLNKKKTKNYKKLVNETEKLSETSEEMIKERQQAQQDMKVYQKKIDCLMGRISGPQCDGIGPKQDEVKVRQAAPAPAPVVAPAVIVKKIVAPKAKDKFGETIKILPFLGTTTFMSENEDLESDLALGIKLESNVSSRFSVGLGFKYTTMTTSDYGTNNNYNYNGGFGNSFSNYQGREIEYKNINIDLYSKFYLIKNNRFRPYVGAGLGYNRTSMEYTNSYDSNSNGGFQNYNYSFGSEEVSTTSINAEMMLGSEVVFTENMGMVVEFNYARGLGGNVSSENASFNNQAPDQARLEDLNAELQEANILSLYAGMLVQW